MLAHARFVNSADVMQISDAPVLNSEKNNTYEDISQRFKHPGTQPAGHMSAGHHVTGLDNPLYKVKDDMEHTHQYNNMQPHSLA